MRILLPDFLSPLSGYGHHNSTIYSGTPNCRRLILQHHCPHRVLIWVFFTMYIGFLAPQYRFFFLEYIFHLLLYYELIKRIDSAE
jgi:hypothetical protein